ncbi:hypothetical protein SCUCBS95973_001146 [Sporothrix curviconia]|uniref:Sulfite reductase beta subunit n=1 Tax=Sporothrix curviconia TaxID=1260050 RepID=A0ABP0AW70_9PEZI
MATSENTDAASADPDPVIARYNVFLKPQLPAHQKLLVLQYPNRVYKSSAGGPGAVSFSGQTPTELRIKTGSGMVEVDVPIDYTSAYDRAKGVAWGSALATSTKAKAGGSHGLAGGFGVSGTHGHGRNGGSGRAAAAAAAAAAQAEAEGRTTTSTADWSEAVRQDRVLRLQTLGGMCPPSRIAEAKWMIGAFDGGNLHLTPVSSLVHLRPQLHHIDAETEVERAKHRDTSAAGGAGGDGAGGAGGSAGGAGGASSGRPGGPGGPRAIHMTVKSAGADGDEIITETMADRLRAVQMENWARMLYVGDDDENSWEVYDQTLFLKDAAGAMASATAAATTENAEAAAREGAKGKGVATEKVDKGANDNSSSQVQLVTKVPALRTNWTEDDMLQAISKIEKPSEDLAPAQKPANKPKAIKGKGKAVTASVPASTTPVAGSAEMKSEHDAQSTSPSAQRRTRPLARPAASLAAAGATAPPSRGRGDRRQTGAARGSAMDLD